MPRIRFIKLRCGCGAEYKVRIERIGEGDPFECVSCGAVVEVRPYVKLLELVHDYSEVVLRIEDEAQVEGDVLIPLEKKAVSKARSFQGG